MFWFLSNISGAEWDSETVYSDKFSEHLPGERKLEVKLGIREWSSKSTVQYNLRRVMSEPDHLTGKDGRILA